AAFGLRRRQRAISTIDCGKAEFKLSSILCTILPLGTASTAPRPSSRHASPGTAEAKNFCAKIRRNPLISHDSHERIQGNPSFSNPQI
ncbi:MAG TPA: hypothetical protein VLI91_08295, partial [Roseiarcus sp.]|nr:hypothetical protein [Roseiarcus sp.]